MQTRISISSSESLREKRPTILKQSPFEDFLNSMEAFDILILLS